MCRTALIFLFPALLLLLTACSPAGPPPEIELTYEESLSMEYDEVIHAYKAMADYYPGAELLEMGATDVGKPLHLFMISGDGDFDPASIRDKGRSIVLINNGIHAGDAISQLNFILNHITRDKTERGWHLYPVAHYPE